MDHTMNGPFCEDMGKLSQLSSILLKASTHRSVSGGGLDCNAGCHNDAPGSCSVEDKKTVDLHAQGVASLLITHSTSQAGLIAMGPAWIFPSPLDRPWSYLEKPAPWSPVLSVSEKPPGCSDMLGVQCRRYVWSVMVNATFRHFGHVKP
ncbi:hypothetical protein llap_7154 [Limosa lapponica baueri]|uniref:Uncharacterized protein n=1 Tax=Limosa lapponica baueri TaxID=1758121 RepID=A0A2I0U932_LIMLA|nr:hypothetical protein llap_7154 [Limosa lapponica baueri]